MLSEGLGFDRSTGKISQKEVVFTKCLNFRSKIIATTKVPSSNLYEAFISKKKV